MSRPATSIRELSEILDFLETLNRDGLTLVIVTHDETIASRAPRRVHIVDGRIEGRVHRAKAGIHPRLVAAPARRPVFRSGITPRDLTNEAFAGMFARPGRMALTVLGVVIGLCALVATVGLTRTAGNRIISQFDQLAATELFITARPGTATGTVDPKAIPWDAPARLQRLNGVVARGRSAMSMPERRWSAFTGTRPAEPRALKVAVRAASPDMFAAVRAVLETGRLPMPATPSGQNGSPYSGRTPPSDWGFTASSAFRDLDRRSTLSGDRHTARRRPQARTAWLDHHSGRYGTSRFPPRRAGTVVVETKVGAAQLIAEQAPIALRPDDPVR